MRRLFAPILPTASAVLFILFFFLSAFGAGQSAAAGSDSLPSKLDNALEGMLSAISPNIPPNQTYMNEILNFVSQNTKKDERVEIESRPEGLGVFRHVTLNAPFSKLLGYIANPNVPGEVLGPSAVRINTWYPGSEVLTKADAFRATPLPPSAPVVMRGTEYEETTPDVSSGGYYSYKLNRLFVLTSYQGRTALFSVSRMPTQSSIGKKGGILGKDGDWTYVYTPEEGTNLSLVGWADTYLYGSSSVSLFLESAPGSNSIDLYMFKWVRAGWSDMNVVKASHIREGVDRFIETLSTVVESPRSPSPEAIAAYRQELQGLDDTVLRERLKDFSADLATRGAKDSLLSEKDFQAVLEGGKYATTLSRQQMISELMKLYLRKQLGKPVPAVN